MNNHPHGHALQDLLQALAAHLKINAMAFGSLLGLIINIDLDRLVNTAILAAVGATSSYLATQLISMLVSQRKKNK